MRAMEILREECRALGCLETYAGEIAYKAYELGCRNTLFSYLQTARRVDMGFLRELRTYLKENSPDIEQNPYYREEDAETRKLVGLHLKSPVLFLGYYRLLNLYRRFRGGKRDRA